MSEAYTLRVLRVNVYNLHTICRLQTSMMIEKIFMFGFSVNGSVLEKVLEISSTYDLNLPF